MQIRSQLGRVFRLSWDRRLFVVPWRWRCWFDLAVGGDQTHVEGAEQPRLSEELGLSPQILGKPCRFPAFQSKQKKLGYMVCTKKGYRSKLANLLFTVFLICLLDCFFRKSSFDQHAHSLRRLELKEYGTLNVWTGSGCIGIWRSLANRLTPCLNSSLSTKHIRLNWLIYSRYCQKFLLG